MEAETQRNGMKQRKCSNCAHAIAVRYIVDLDGLPTHCLCRKKKIVKQILNNEKCDDFMVRKTNFVYISGNIEDENTMPFQIAEDYVVSCDGIPVSSLRISDECKSKEERAKKRIKALLDCDSIYMVKGWKKSKIAKLEHFIALKLGMKIENER